MYTIGLVVWLVSWLVSNFGWVVVAVGGLAGLFVRRLVGWMVDFVWVFWYFCVSWVLCFCVGLV